MNFEKEFNDLNFKLSLNINSKCLAKIENINASFQEEVKKLNNNYSINENGFNFYIKRLNEQRIVLLDELIEKRNSQLKKFNEYINYLHQNKYFKNDIERISVIDRQNGEIKKTLISNNYIILVFEKFNEKNFLTTIKLYDYHDFKLFKEIKIDDQCSFIKIVKNNNDFALQKHSVDVDILIYEEKSYDEPKSITLLADEKPFFELNSLRRPNINQLIHFNDSKLYIDDKINTVYIFDRFDISKWMHFKYNGEVKFDEMSRIYVCITEKNILKSIEMRDLSGFILGYIENPKFNSFEFDRFGNYILNKTKKNNYIIYNEF